MSKFTEAQRRYMTALKQYNDVVGLVPRPPSGFTQFFIQSFVWMQRNLQELKEQMDEAERAEQGQPAADGEDS